MDKPVECKFGQHEWENASPKYAHSDEYVRKQKCVKCGEVRSVEEEPKE